MIIDLPDTTTGQINKELVRVRAESGVVTLGRVLTLVIDATGADDEAAIASAIEASREHPCRVVVLSPTNEATARLDAEIRVGGDGGSGEIVVLRPSREMAEHDDTLVIPLLLPDAPIVTWWPADPPTNPSGTRIGAMATRRITDAKGEPDAQETLARLASSYRPGDTDLAWARLTRWRALLAVALEQVDDRDVTNVRIHGAENSASVLLLGAWFKKTLGCGFEATTDTTVKGLLSVVLETPSGEIGISRNDPATATFSQPEQPAHVIALPHRTLNDCLAEELRSLDADPLYGDVLAVAGGSKRP